MCVRPKMVFVRCCRRLGREEEAKRKCHEERKFVCSCRKTCTQRRGHSKNFITKAGITYLVEISPMQVFPDQSQALAPSS